MKTNEFAIKRKKVAESVKPVEQPKVVKPEDLTMPEFVFESADRQYRHALSEQLVDMKGKKCTACKKGTYQETDIQDDMHGELHCTKCNTVIKSRQPAKSKKKGMSEQQVGEAGGSFTAAGHYNNMIFQQNLNNLGQQLSQLSPADLEQFNQIAASVGIGSVAGVAGVIGAVTFGDMFMSVMRQTMGAAKKKVSVDTEEIIKLRRQIVSIHKRLATLKTEPAIAKYQAMLKQAYEVLEELEARQGNQVAEGKPQKRADRYHINKDGKPASLASYADRSSAVKDRDAQYPGAKVHQVGPRGKVKGEFEEGMAEGSGQQLNIQQLATISDEALDNAYHYGRSSPGNTFGWQANLKSAAYAKQMIDQGVTDIEAISDAIHKGWNVTAKAFVQNPDQFDDTEKLKAAGKLEAKLQQRAKLMNIGYAQLPDDEQEKDRVVARALLQALKGQQGVAEGGRLDMSSPEEKAARKAYIKAHGHPPPLTPDSVVAKYNPENDKKMRDYYLRRKGIPQDKLDKMKEDGVAEASRGFRGVGGAREREDDERYDLDPSDWYIVKDGKLLKASIYPRQEAQARAEGFSPTREQARARASNKGVAEGRTIVPAADTLTGAKKLWQYISRNLIDLASMASFYADRNETYVEERLANLLKTPNGQSIQIAFDMGPKIEFEKGTLYIPIGVMERYRGMYMSSRFVNDVINAVESQQGVAEGLKEDATGGSTGSSSVSAVVTELGAGGMTKQQLRKRQADYTNVRKAGGPVKVKRNG